MNSGINITPSILDFIVNLDNPLQKLNLIIKDSSFIASFKSHLTESVLAKLSNEEIKKVVKRKSSRLMIEVSCYRLIQL